MASVDCKDASIDRILDRIDRHGLAAETIVIFSSDNGPGGGGVTRPLSGQKGHMFEGGARIPFLMRWPGLLLGRTVCDEFLAVLEVFPTLVQSAGAEVPFETELDGFNMLPVIQETRSPLRDSMFWERQGEFGARVGHWKLVKSRWGGGLFDLPVGPSESNDLGDRYPHVRERVRHQFHDWVPCHG